MLIIFRSMNLGLKIQNLGGTSFHPGNWISSSRSQSAGNPIISDFPRLYVSQATLPWAASPRWRGCLVVPLSPPSPPWEPLSTCLSSLQPGLLAQLALIKFLLSHISLSPIVLVYVSLQTNVMYFPRGFFPASLF